MSRGRICVLAHSLDTKRGGGRFTFGLISSLEAEGFTLRVLTTLPGTAPNQDSILSSNPLKLFLALPRIRASMADADIIHALDVFPYGILAAVAGFGLRKKLVITAVGSASIQPLYRPFLSLLAASAYRVADHVTATSSYVARRVQEKVNIPTMTVVIPGLEYDYFVSKIAPTSTHQTRPFILTIGKLKRRKGLHISIPAFARAAALHPTLDYVIVGTKRGAYYEEMVRLANDLGVAERVLFKEGVSDEELSGLYRDAELFILLPQNIDNDIEGFGLVFVEAAAFGLPVIGAKDSGAEDAVLDGENGYLVDPLDIESAAERISRIIDNPALRSRFTMRSVEFAKACDWKNIAKQYGALYDRLLQAR